MYIFVLMLGNTSCQFFNLTFLFCVLWKTEVVVLEERQAMRFIALLISAKKDCWFQMYLIAVCTFCYVQEVAVERAGTRNVLVLWPGNDVSCEAGQLSQSPVHPLGANGTVSLFWVSGKLSVIPGRGCTFWHGWRVRLKTLFYGHGTHFSGM